jgi:hypothetical protein
MKQTLLSFFAIAILALTSCDKKDDDTPPPSPPDVTPTQINLVGTYKPVKVVSMQNADISSEWLQNCEKDNLFKLNADLSYVVVDGGVQCATSRFTSGEWSLVNSTTIVLDDEVGTIKRFNGINLDITSYYTGTQMVTIQFVKQ